MLDRHRVGEFDLGEGLTAVLQINNERSEVTFYLNGVQQDGGKFDLGEDLTAVLQINNGKSIVTFYENEVEFDCLISNGQSPKAPIIHIVATKGGSCPNKLLSAVRTIGTALRNGRPIT